MIKLSWFKFLSVLLVIMVLQSCVFHYFEKYTRVQVVNESEINLISVSLMVNRSELKNLASNLASKENSKVVEIEERGEFPIEILHGDSILDTLGAVEMRGGSQRLVIKQVDGRWMY